MEGIALLLRFVGFVIVITAAALVYTLVVEWIEQITGGGKKGP